jgi:hypothetical protein
MKIRPKSLQIHCGIESIRYVRRGDINGYFVGVAGEQVGELTSNTRINSTKITMV